MNEQNGRLQSVGWLGALALINNHDARLH